MNNLVKIYRNKIRLHETANVFVQVKRKKIVTLHSVELACPVKIKQPSKLVQEAREIPR